MKNMKLPVTIVAKPKIAPLWAMVKKHGSQKAVADLLNISPGEFGRWVNGRWKPTRFLQDDKNVKRFIEVIGVHPGDIWPDDLTNDLLNVMTESREFTAELQPSQFQELDVIAQSRLEGPEEIASRHELEQALRDSLQDLTEQEERVLILRFGLFGEDSHTLDDMVPIFGVTRERIRQIECKALMKLRNPNFRSKDLRQFAKDNPNCPHEPDDL